MKNSALILLGLVIGIAVSFFYFKSVIREVERAHISNSQLISGLSSLAHLQYLEKERYDELRNTLTDKVLVYYFEYRNYESKEHDDTAFTSLIEHIEKARLESELLDSKIKERTKR